MKKILCPLIMFFIILSLLSCDTNDESYYLYDVNEDGTLTIMGVSETYSKELKIPKEIDGKTVTAIGDYAFYNNQYVREIILPDSILSIGECSFADSCNLKTVSLGKNCKTIGLQAFEGCSGLKKISLSNALQKIEDLAFAGCTRLESFNPPSTLDEIGINVFDECEQLIIDTTDCPVIDDYAKVHKIPTGFTESDDYQLLKIIILTAIVLSAIIVLKVIFKKIKKRH